ncbi:ABC transporter permease subunit [Kiritimatiellota bacterium B12222]|nr:ABC transporter permease subunit [Kiritimatiellota bacterium B12222]
MLALLALVLLLLPAGLESDGTIQGALRMHIRYSLGFSSFLLAAMTLWASCASIASDLSSKRLDMLLTKPVSRAAVWWGKWLAVVTMMSGLCLICGTVTLFRIHHILQQADLSPEQSEMVMTQQVTARRPIDPLVVDLTEEAHLLADQQIASGAVPEGYPIDVLYEEMEGFLKVNRNAASAGESVEWTFELNKALSPGSEMQVSYQYDGSAMGIGLTPGKWTLGTPEQPELLEYALEETPYGEKVIAITVPEELADAETILLRYENQGTDGGRVFFKTDRGVRLYFNAGNFSLNLFRALFLICGLLAIMAAIGVSAGSVFSLPVACYISAVILLLQAFSGSVEEVVEYGQPAPTEGQNVIARGIETFQYKVYEGVLVLLKPLQVESPLGRVADGVLISPTEVLSVICLRFIPVILFMSGIGIFLFSRREIGGAA